jgi:hypothetical protein
MKEDYLFFAAFDLYGMFEFVVNRSLQKLEAETNAELNNLESNDEARQTAGKEKISAIRNAIKGIDLLTELRTSDFRSLCQKKIPVSVLPSGEADKVGKFADRLSSLVEESYRTGRVTEQAIEILDDREGATKRIYWELFDEELR